MKKQDYESLTRINKVKRLIKVALITLLICLIVLAPALWYWDASVEMRSAYRSAKNVLLNTELLALRYNGTGDAFLDSSQNSGLSLEASEDVRLYSGAKGDFQIIALDAGTNDVLSMTYREGRFLLIYEKEQGADSGEWTVFREVRKYEN